MTVSPTPVFIFSNLVYSIQVQNLGQAAAPITAGVLTDTLPAGVTFVSASASAGWSCRKRDGFLLHHVGNGREHHGYHKHHSDRTVCCYYTDR